MRRRMGLWRGVVVALVVAIWPAAASAATTVEITPTTPNGWAAVQETGSDNVAEIVAGPQPAPAGVGSLHLANPTGGGVIFGTLGLMAQRFDEFTTLEYSAYRSSVDAGNNQAISLQFNVDYDVTDVNTSWQGRLVFEPYQGPGNGGTVLEDTWQTWNALTGYWWATGAPGSATCPQASPCTISTLLTTHPDLGVNSSFGGFGLKAGSGPVGFDGYADALTIGILGDDTTYDFEPDEMLGDCVVASTGSSPTTYTLLADCTTDETIVVPQHAGGTVFDGNGYSITAVDPSGGHFVGAVVQAEAGSDEITVENLTVKTLNLADACHAGDDRLRGILFDGVSGTVTNNTVTDLEQGAGGTSGCQEGNAIDVRNSSGATPKPSVTVSNNDISEYQKTGILATQNVVATLTDNTVTGDGPITYIAENGIQISSGATAKLVGNDVSLNNYSPPKVSSCGLLLVKAGGISGATKSGIKFVKADNDFHDNEVNVCNFGKGGTFSPAP